MEQTRPASPGWDAAQVAQLESGAVSACPEGIDSNRGRHKPFAIVIAEMLVINIEGAAGETGLVEDA